MSTFFYSNQIRRFLFQFARMFSNFEVEGAFDDTTGLPVLTSVPIRYGDVSKQGQTIQQQNSASSLPCAPMMSFYINSLKYNRPMTQEPFFVDKKYIRQREWNETIQAYEESQGNAFLVERQMPVPYILGITLDIWTTNTQTKLQLLEQILPYFNPSLEIQSSDNYLDWTSLSVVEIEDQTWSTRTIPGINDDEIDIASLRFKLPIWISPPAKVTKGGVIHKIIASIYDESGKYVDAIDSDDILLGTRLKVSPHGYQIFLLGNELRVLPHNAPGDDRDIQTIPDINSAISWRGVIDEYGVLNNGISQIRLEADGIDDVIGTISYHPTDPNVLLFTVDVDTLPTNTLNPVDAVIDPQTSGPGIGLPAAALGQRYLLVNDTGDTNDSSYASAWYGTAELVANENDIIEYDGTNWIVSFDASAETTTQYATNITTNIQYKFQNNMWLRSYEGIYTGGQWGLVL